MRGTQRSHLSSFILFRTLKKSMRSYKKIEKKYKPEEIAESFVFSGDTKVRSERLVAFQQFRSQANANAKQSEKDKVIAQLLQLKFQIEDYIK